jgi:homoserine kinase
MKFKNNFKILSPATVTNMGCGSGIFGLALNNPQDEIIVKTIKNPGIHISTIYNNKSKISLNTNENSAGIAATEVLNHLIREHGLPNTTGLEFSITKKIPIGQGLGSALASACAGAVAANTAFGTRLSKHELIPLIRKAISEIKQSFYINSLIPALMGGLNLIREQTKPDFHRIPVPRALHIVLSYQRQRNTRHKNKAPQKPFLIDNTPDMQQIANTGALIHGLYTSDFDLIARSLKETFGEEHWEKCHPGFKKAKEATLKSKALSCNITGGGPAIFAICKSSVDAETTGEALLESQSKVGKKSKIIISTINQEGTILA